MRVVDGVAGRAATPDELAAHDAQIEAWLARQKAENPVIVAVERDPDVRRWYVRLRGEERDYVAVWLTLGEYTLASETYVMPAPEENAGELYEYLLRQNARASGMAFAIGAEDAVYLRGNVPLAALSDDELDRIVGSAYAYVEQWFRPAMSIGFRSRFPR
jgi:hypothetical protein